MIKTQKLVMIPGPTPVARPILNQLARDTVAFGDPDFVQDLKNLVEDLRVTWKCDGEAFVIAGSGTLAMEMALSNITKAGENVLIASQGFFGDRFIEMSQRKGLNVDVLKSEWGSIYTIDQLDKVLSEKTYAALTLTHVDTSTAAVIPLKEICAMIRKNHPDVLVIVDGVAATGGVEASMDWGIDILFTCSQKAFGVPPGLAMLWASERAVARRKSFASIPESYMDFERWTPIMRDPSKYWGTPAVNLVWALKEALAIMKAEGLPERYERHARQAELLRSSVEALGFKVLAEKNCRAPTLSVFLYPENAGIQDLDFRTKLALEGAQSAACLGAYAGKGFRMGHMGNIDKHYLVSCIAAIERACIKAGYAIEPGKALAVLQAGLARE